ncbi:SDR family NAD(P)-dependent oxidoreductase [Amycolatopsis jejuensis]|uniref:SDR family NAD(P)-dependent oxidoreductase n=1 Tax=Amycolatopsis jejuensis TaxID=330084 RepID=UPI000526F0C9|nr:SDR family oxidoreductase [Amycolatopsis jejuensis]
MTLDGRVSIVTGAGRHLGRAYALGLAAAGSAVVVADLADAEPVAAEIRDRGGQALSVRIDVNDGQTLDTMAKTAFDAFGRIDALVNNAGYFKNAARSPIEDIEIDEWDRSFAINVRGTWLAAKAVLPAMKRAGYGKIVNIGSTTCLNGIPGFLHYVSAKSAIFGMTRAMARELGEFGICVNTLNPDLIPDDEMLRDNPANNERAIAGRALKRTETPEDMIGSVVFLCGPGSDFLTGQSVNVNGGNVFV